jgi:hypothetical protein
MPVVLRPSRLVPLPSSGTFNKGSFFMLPLACLSGFWSLATILLLSTVPVYAGMGGG